MYVLCVPTRRLHNVLQACSTSQCCHCKLLKLVTAVITLLVSTMVSATAAAANRCCMNTATAVSTLQTAAAAYTHSKRLLVVGASKGQKRKPQLTACYSRVLR
jgi:hypothetical protein